MVGSYSAGSDQPKPVNVASVPHRSPFRYPGGKTWLVQCVRAWMHCIDPKPRVFVEPFAGGAIVGLTVAAERLADRVILAELDAAVAAVWKVILSGEAESLVRRILDFEVTRDNVLRVLRSKPQNEHELAFQTIVRNRMQRGGILARGASLVKCGENGRGLCSRWYPATLARRIRAIAEMRDRIEFFHIDAFAIIPQFARQKTAAVFIDPPYTAGGKHAGKRLYTHYVVDHQSLFAFAQRAACAVMMTYDESTEVLELARRFRLCVNRVPMKSTHHRVAFELVLTNRPWTLAPASSCTRTLFD